MHQDSLAHQLPVTNSLQLEQQPMRRQPIAGNLPQIILEFNILVGCLLQHHRLVQLEHVQIMELHRLAVPLTLLIAAIQV